MDEEQAHHLELVQAEEEMALADVSAQVLRCSAYESVIRAAAADEGIIIIIIITHTDTGEVRNNMRARPCT